MIALFLQLFIRNLAGWYEGKSDKSYIKFLEQFSVLTSKVVSIKLARFKDEAINLRRDSNTFKQITQPKAQINTILGEVESLLLNNFGIKKKQVSVTIMSKTRRSGVWGFEYQTTKGWNHTKAQELIGRSSAASECLKIGEPVFHASKNVAARNKQYFKSERDRKAGDGSVFCYPSIIQNRDYESQYIVSIVTYGNVLCDHLDDDQCEAICRIFTDICQRIDLELTLNSIKEWQYGFHSDSDRRA